MEIAVRFGIIWLSQRWRFINTFNCDISYLCDITLHGGQYDAIQGIDVIDAPKLVDCPLGLQGQIIALHVGTGK